MPKNGYITPSGLKPILVDGKVVPPFGRGAITYGRWIARHMCGIDDESFESSDIDRGNEQEQEAIDFFEKTFLIEGHKPEFTIHPDISYFGGTADMIYPDFGIDIKNPNTKNHHDNLAEGMQLVDYKHQLQGYMSIYGKDKWGLVSYNCNFNDNSKIAIAWMDREQDYIDNMLERIKLFYPVVLDEFKKLEKYHCKL